MDKKQLYFYVGGDLYVNPKGELMQIGYDCPLVMLVLVEDVLIELDCE